MTLLRDLIEIPEQVQRGDFVLRLAEGVTHPEATLRHYVVTPELRGCFDNALSFLESALGSRTSKATYLHGSFGSGKSHFMAILHLILQGHAGARSLPELAAVIQKHNAWTAGKKFLLVPYHMIGAADMESGILGGYVDYIRRAHPEAPIPGVYRAEGLFQDASRLRESMGDAAFFARLSEGAAADGGWGELEAGWDAERFETAMLEPPNSEERTQLIAALIGKFFGSYDLQAGGRGEAFLPLDQGLSVLSKHAAALGYDAVILFLDELILWLASHASDLKFVHQEGQKLAKLVEAQTPDRPAPIVSFVARQRDLRELIGDTIPGAERLNFGDSLGHWEGRFHRITLEDRNLPAIVEKRLLKPRSEAARATLEQAFTALLHLREPVMNALLTGEGDRAMFRKVYPFSPALVQTLIAVSSVLQSDRTALKVMMQLLVDGRNTLKLGDIVPVGDLFDVIAHGDEAFSPEMAIHFDNAKRLYHQKLLPLLEREHGRREELERLPYDDPKRAAFRANDRLVKTLLLAALVPEVETLRSLSAERLAALNHGSIRTPIAGREAQEVLRRCRNWAAAVGEIRIGEEANPTITVQLSGVDTEAILEQARREDNLGNRVRRVRQTLFEQMQIQGMEELEPRYEFLWKNTKRTCGVLFRNLRELSDGSLENEGPDWRLVVDYPFDESDHGPGEDRRRLEEFRANHPQGAHTLCWAPSPLSSDAQKDLGLLVILDHIMTGERFSQYSGHLSAQDRQAAKSLLENQRSVLTQRVKNHLDAAYGLDELSAGSLDPAQRLDLDERFRSLAPGFDLRPPVAANLGQALPHLLGQALSWQFPAAPEFGAEVKPLHLKKVADVVLEACRTVDGRIEVEKPLRPLLLQIANPLRLGEMGADVTHFVLGRHWQSHFQRKLAETGAAPTVRRLREWLDDPQPMGLPVEAQNLVILTFAAQTNRSFFLHGAPREPTLSHLSNDLELREEKLPPVEQWEVAVARAESLFGVRPSPLLKGANVVSLAGQVKTAVGKTFAPCKRYAGALRERLEAMRISVGEADRLTTAAASLALVERLHAAREDEVVGILATAEIATSEAAMHECLAQADTLAGVLDATAWALLELAPDLPDDLTAEAEAIRADTVTALRSDEHAVALKPALETQQRRAIELLRRAAGKPSPPPPGNAGVSPAAGQHGVPPTATTPSPPDARTLPPVSPLPPVLQHGRRVVRQGSREGLDLAAAREELAKLEDDARRGRTVRINLSWIVEGDGAA